MERHPEVDGAVSLWAGIAASQAALESYVEIDYSTNDMSRISPFADDFGTGWHDEDLMEVGVKGPTRSLSELLRGYSYDWIIVPKFVALCGDMLPEPSNAVVLLYNFRHNGSPGFTSSAGGPVRLRYMRSIAVEMPWPD